MKTTFMMIITVLSFFIVPSVYADQGPAHKLSRGIVNIVTAPVEIPKQARSYWIEGAYKTDHVSFWIASGTVWGIIQTAKRIGSGTWDVVSFPLPVPDDYRSLIQPDYVFQDWPSDPDVFIFKKKQE